MSIISCRLKRGGLGVGRVPSEKPPPLPPEVKARSLYQQRKSGRRVCVLQVVLGDDGVSVHAVLLQSQVVGAAAAALVGAGHDPEPAPLPLHKVYKLVYLSFNVFVRVKQKPGLWF